MRRGHPRVELTEYQEQVLTGLMLGDGHLSRYSKATSGILSHLRTKNAHLVVKRSIEDDEYLKYEAKLFFNLLTPTYQKKLITYNNQAPDPRTHKSYPSCTFTTMANPIFTEWHDKWYQGKVKIVPPDLQLSSVAIAHWVADDGSISLSSPKLPHRFKMELSTHGFTQTEVDFLANLLHQRYNEKFNVFINRKQWFILAYDNACRAVFADIDPYFKMMRKQLWKRPDARFYSNQPERQISTKEELALKVEKLKEIISTQDQIPMKELIQRLGYVKGSVDHLQSVFKFFPDQITIDSSIRSNYIIHFNQFR